MADKDIDHLLEHSYDGIQEYDNPLPTWWKLIFYATILVVPIYMWDPFGIGVGPGREKVYQQDMAAFAAAHPAATGATFTEGSGASPGKRTILAQRTERRRYLLHPLPGGRYGYQRAGRTEVARIYPRGGEGCSQGKAG